MDAVCGIGVGGLKILAAAFSASRLLPILVDTEKPDQALRALTATELDQEQAFLNAWGAVDSMLEDRHVALLVQQGFTFRSDQDRGEGVAAALIEDPERFDRAYSRRLGSESFGDRAYRVFGRTSIPVAPNPKPFGQAALKTAKARCDTYFKSRGCGPAASVKLYLNEKRIGLVIHRGSTRSGRAKMDLQEHVVTRRDRDTKTDIVFLDLEDFHIWVSAAEADAQHYAELMGELINGNTRTFLRRVHFNLSFALSQDLHTQLQGAGGPDVKTVALRKRRIVGLPNNETRYHSAKTRYECLSITSPIDIQLRELGRVDDVKLKIELEAERRIGGMIEVKENSIYIDPAINSVGRRILRDLKVVTFDGN
jgi:hypothetical protein